MATKKAATGTAVAVKKPSGAVVDLKAKMAADLAALANRTGNVGGNKIQLKNKQFVLPSGETVDELDLVIVDFISLNTFYQGAYDPKNIQPPVCFALGDIPTQMVPSDNSPLKQNEACGSCPMNAFGSAGDGKACKNQRRLAVLPPGGTEDDEMWTLDVSPTGLKSFDGYVRSAASKHAVLPVGLITKVTFDPNVSYGSLRFSEPRPNPDMGDHYNRMNEARDLLAQEPDVSGYEADPAPRARGKAPAKGARR